jgi:hypothetical protein
VFLHTPRSPFYRPKAARSRLNIFGRQFLPSASWRTGHSGARFVSFYGEADR